jgi:hypothetical protein
MTVSKTQYVKRNHILSEEEIEEQLRRVPTAHRIRVDALQPQLSAGRYDSSKAVDTAKDSHSRCADKINNSEHRNNLNNRLI